MTSDWFHVLLVTMMVSLVKGDPEFYSFKPARCRNGDKDVDLYGFTWTKCLKSCRKRRQCLAVSYRRSFHQCVLNYGINSNNDPDVCIGFMYAEKQVGYEKDAQDCTGNGAADECPAKECPRHTLLRNGQVHGNMITTGSTLKVTCNTEFTIVGADQFICNDDGHWVDDTAQRPTIVACAAADRLNDFSVFVGTESCVYFQGKAGAIVNVTCSTGAMVGNSVTIQQNLHYGLTLCEVMVF